MREPRTKTRDGYSPNAIENIIHRRLHWMRETQN